MDMELTYIYHSGFALSGDGFTVIMDYYRDSEDGQAQSDLNRLMDGTFSNQEAGMPEGIVHSELLRRPGKLFVLASPFHPHHFNKEVLHWREQRPDIIYIFSKDILRCLLYTSTALCTIWIFFTYPAPMPTPPQSSLVTSSIRLFRMVIPVHNSCS